MFALSLATVTTAPSPARCLSARRRRGVDAHRITAAALPAVGLRGAPGDGPFDDAALPHHLGRETADRRPHPPADALIGRRPAGSDVRGVPAPLQDLGVL